jgi:hypothetical protein
LPHKDAGVAGEIAIDPQQMGDRSSATGFSAAC